MFGSVVDIYIVTFNFIGMKQPVNYNDQINTLLLYSTFPMRIQHY